MKFFTRHWYNIGLIVLIFTLAFLGFNWSSLEMLQRLQLMSFIAILFHQFEEYGFPGGEPAIMNIALQNSDMPDRYPLNQFSAMLINVLVTYTVYLIPVFYPNAIGLGLVPMIFGFGQFIVHGIVTNIKMKTFYNPGLFAVVFLHYPIGIYYIYYIVSNNLVRGFDWVIAVLGLVGAMACVNIITYRLLPNRNTKFVFDKVEMKRFNVQEKMNCLKK